MSHPRRNKQIPQNAELYCPQYREFDRKAREDSKVCNAHRIKSISPNTKQD